MQLSLFVLGFEVFRQTARLSRLTSQLCESLIVMVNSGPTTFTGLGNITHNVITHNIQQHLCLHCTGVVAIMHCVVPVFHCLVAKGHSEGAKHLYIRIRGGRTGSHFLEHLSKQLFFAKVVTLHARRTCVCTTVRPELVDSTDDQRHTSCCELS